MCCLLLCLHNYGLQVGNICNASTSLFPYYLFFSLWQIFRKSLFALRFRVPVLRFQISLLIFQVSMLRKVSTNIYIKVQCIRVKVLSTHVMVQSILVEFPSTHVEVSSTSVEFLRTVAKHEHILNSRDEVPSSHAEQDMYRILMLWFQLFVSSTCRYQVYIPTLEYLC